MLLPHAKEREYRFKLALRMGLPIFALVLALVSNTLITTYESLNASFYLESILLIAFSIYFIFYLIYSAFDIRITESVSKVFTREYLYKYLIKELEKNREYTLILISIDNLNEINSRYGIKNGDKVVFSVAKWIGEYLQSKDINNFPLGHIKGGDFIIGLQGNKENYSTILELMCLKSEEFKVDDIEVKISGAINDISFSNNLDYMVENLFELQELSRNQKLNPAKLDEINPSELESFVIKAIKLKSFTVMKQDVFENEKVVIKECFIKLKTPQGKMLHQKTYMKVLDKLGLMLDYDLMVLEKSISNCKKENSDIFALSISPTSIRNPMFARRVKELFNANPEVKNRVIFLLSEGEYYSQISKYNTILKSLKNLGVSIAIDRLGAIHTSFLYLRDLDIDVVRFDSFYTKDIEKNSNKSIIDGFNLMAHKKGVKTWIKMIENEDIKQEAKKLKVDYLQGKYLAPLEKFYDN